MTLYPVIMAGGAGTRFWPLSRKNRPKQFLPLAGEGPLIASTVGRLPPLARIERTYVVCGPNHAATVRRLVPRLPKANLLVEPCPRNTAPCVGLAALHVARRDPKGVMVMLPADHHIARPDAFREALAAAAELARKGAIATIGIRPSRPETGYGYLKLGARMPASGKARGRHHPYRVERFVEKPDVVTAARYLAEGNYLWNSGIFVFRADVILEEIRKAMPVLGEQLEVIGESLGTPRYLRTLRRVFPGAPVDLHRLRRHGEEPAHRGGAGRVRLERRRQLRRPLRGARDRRPRQRGRGRRASSSTAAATWCWHSGGARWR